MMVHVGAITITTLTFTSDVTIPEIPLRIMVLIAQDLCWSSFRSIAFITFIFYITPYSVLWRLTFLICIGKKGWW